MLSIIATDFFHFCSRMVLANDLPVPVMRLPEKLRIGTAGWIMLILTREQARLFQGPLAIFRGTAFDMI